MKEKWVSFIASLIGATILLSVLLVSRFFGSIAVTSESMLNTIVQADATILGFFGLIAIYAFTAFDNRTDRFEQQLFELTTEKHPNMKEDALELEKSRLERHLVTIQRNKKELVDNAFGAGLFLVLSLILSMFSLAKVPFASDLCTGAIYFMLFSIWFIFVIFRSFGKTPETT